MNDKIVLHRFCSREEFDKYMAGEKLTNHTDHSKKRGTATTSTGFCFFTEDPDEAKHRLSGIVDFDVCLTVEADRRKVKRTKGRYADHSQPIFSGACVMMDEYCTPEYDRDAFKLVGYTDAYADYAPGPKKLREMFLLFPIV